MTDTEFILNLAVAKVSNKFVNFKFYYKRKRGIIKELGKSYIAKVNILYISLSNCGYKG